MKIGDECWVVVEKSGAIVETDCGCIYHVHDEEYIDEDPGETAVRVRIVPADEWQTMESAPKDGTEVLLWEPDNTWYVGWWNGKYWLAGWCSKDLTPTHWRPLPPGPEVK